MADATAALNAAIFDRLFKRPKPPVWAEDPLAVGFLEKLKGGVWDNEHGVFADWLDETCTPEGLKGAKAIREILLDKAKFRAVFKEVMDEAQQLNTSFAPSSLAEAARRHARNCLYEGFGWYFTGHAMDAVNEFTRTKMREEGMFRRMLPPLPIENIEINFEVLPAGDVGPITVRDDVIRTPVLRGEVFQVTGPDTVEPFTGGTLPYNPGNPRRRAKRERRRQRRQARRET